MSICRCSHFTRAVLTPSGSTPSSTPPGALATIPLSPISLSSKAGKKKPQPTDPLHPNKSDFIRAKHQQLAYVFKPAKDDLLVTESDLSKQLHSSVRTPNLETSLRLLSQGADPNYFHPEKSSTPLAVAGKAGQACQVDLTISTCLYHTPG